MCMCVCVYSGSEIGFGDLVIWEKWEKWDWMWMCGLECRWVVWMWVMIGWVPTGYGII